MSDVDEVIEEAAEEAAEEAVEEAAEEAAEEAVEDVSGDSDGDTTVVVVDEGDSATESLNDALDAAETIRAIAREEAQAAANRVAGDLAGVIEFAISEHETNMPHAAAFVAPPPSAEQDEDVPTAHWYFRNRGRRNA